MLPESKSSLEKESESARVKHLNERLCFCSSLEQNLTIGTRHRTACGMENIARRKVDSRNHP